MDPVTFLYIIHFFPTMVVPPWSPVTQTGRQWCEIHFQDLYIEYIFIDWIWSEYTELH